MQESETSAVPVADSVQSLGELRARIRNALDRAEVGYAGELLDAAIPLFPQDRMLLGLRADQRRTVLVKALIDEVKDASADNRYVQALGAFREAANLARGSRPLEEILVQLAVAQTNELAIENWRVAAALLAETRQLEAAANIPAEVPQRVARAQRQEIVASVLADIDKSATSESIYRARQRAIQTLDQYPDEHELQVKLATLNFAILDQEAIRERSSRVERLNAEVKALDRIDDLGTLRTKIAALKKEWSAFRSEGDVVKVLQGLETHLVLSEKATEELQQDRLSDCLATCANALAGRPYSLLLLDLKEKAEAVVATTGHIQKLLDEGQVSQAERACRAALALHPQSLALKKLREQISSQINTVQTLITQAQQCLAKRETGAAGELFVKAAKTCPSDRELADHLIEEIQNQARVALNTDAKAAQSTLELAKLIQQSYEAPPDLTASIAAELKRQELLERAEADQRTVISLRKAYEVAGSGKDYLSLRKQVIESKLSESPDQNARDRAAELLADIEQKLASKRQVPVIPIGLTIALGVVAFSVFVLWKTQPVAPHVIPSPVRKAISEPAPKPVETRLPAEIRAPVAANEETREPKPDKAKPAIKESSPDAKAISAEKRPDTGVEAEEANGNPEWEQVNKTDPESLRAFAEQFPASDHSQTALDLAQSLVKANAEKAEQAKRMLALEAEREASNAAARADDGAWQAVKSSDSNSLEEYLSKHPTGRHADQATSSLNALRSQAAAAESASVLQLIAKLESAWDAKDINGILSLQPGLDRRALKLQLSQAQTLAMRITPIGLPEIAGTHATVTCRRQADEVFSDGSIRKNPALVITYVLSKRNGAWTIDGMR